MKKNLNRKLFTFSFLLFVCISNLNAQSSNLFFIKNNGQWSDSVNYAWLGNGVNMFFCANSIVYDFFEAPSSTNNKELCEANSHLLTNAHSLEMSHPKLETDKRHAIKMSFLNNTNNLSKMTLIAENKIETYFNYYLGNDKTKWKTRVPAFERLIYKNVFHNIDLIYYFVDGNLKYDYIASPGSNVNDIEMLIEGADIHHSSDGGIDYAITVGSFQEESPYAYQVSKNSKKETSVDVSFDIKNNLLRFKLGEYDSTQILVIDPTLLFATYSGDPIGAISGAGTTVMSNGNVVATGLIANSGFPPFPGAYQLNAVPGAAFNYGINIFNSTGTTLLASTYLGGNAQEYPHFVKCTETDEIVIYGFTQSGNFPTTSGVIEPIPSGGTMPFANITSALSVLSSDCTTLITSTYFGTNCFPKALDLGADGSIWIAGDVQPGGYIPISSGIPFQPTLIGGMDFFVAHLSFDCQTVLSHTYFGGTEVDGIEDLDVLKNGNVVVVGSTSSTNFPTSSFAYNPTISGNRDGFATILSSNLSNLVASTYIGTLGNIYDAVNSVKESPYDNSIYIAGTNDNSDYPISAGVYSVPDGNLFIDRLCSDLSNSIESTRIGDNGVFTVDALDINKCGDIAVHAIVSAVTNMPTTPGALMAFDLTITPFYLCSLGDHFQYLNYATAYGFNPSDHTHGRGQFDDSGNFYHAYHVGDTSLIPYYYTPGAFSATITGMATYKFNLYSGNSCTDFISVIGGDTIVCQGETLSIPSVGIDPIFWYDSSGTLLSTNDTLIFFPTQSTYIVVKGICSVYDTIYIGVNVCGLNITLPNDTICIGACTELVATLSGQYTAPVSFQWDNGITSMDSTETVCPTVTTTYMVIATDALGEQDTAFANVTVLSPPVVDLGSDTVICSNQYVLDAGNLGSSYLWNNGSSNQTLIASATGTYWVVVDNGGCTDSSGVNLTFSGFEVNLGADTTLCEPVNLILNSGISGASYLWSDGSMAQNLTISSAGLYWVEVSQNSCTNTDSIVVSSVPLPVLTLTSDTSVCLGQSVTLNVSGASTYSWSPAAGLNVTVGNSVSASPTTTTMYHVTGTTMGCSSSDSVLVTVFPNPTLLVDDITICEGIPDTLTVSGADIYTWAPPTGLSATTGSTVIANPVNTTIYTVTGTNTLTTCSSTEQVTVTVEHVTVSVNTDTICQGGVPSSVTLTASGANSYLWSPGTDLSSTTGSSVLCSATQTRIYTVIGTTINLCVDSAQTTVTVIPDFDVTVNSASICEGQSVILTASGANSYTWHPATGLNTNTGPQVTSSPSSTITYTVIGTVSGCSDSATSTVTVYPLPNATITATPNPVNLLHPFVLFKTNAQGNSVAWYYDNDLLSTLEEFTHEFTQGEPGNYEIVLVQTNQLGCSDTARITIIIEEDIIFYIPNTFTPDGNEFNQVFQPVLTSGIDLTSYQLEIYDRWGELIFETTDTNNGWDGTYKEKLCQDGTYVWKIRFKSKYNDGKFEYEGHVNLLR